MELHTGGRAFNVALTFRWIREFSGSGPLVSEVLGSVIIRGFIFLHFTRTSASLYPFGFHFYRFYTWSMFKWLWGRRRGYVDLYDTCIIRDEQTVRSSVCPIAENTTGILLKNNQLSFQIMFLCRIHFKFGLKLCWGAFLWGIDILKAVSDNGLWFFELQIN